MPREKTAGGSLRDGSMEVAPEQWTEQAYRLSKLQRCSYVTGKQYRKKFLPVLTECRESFSEVRW